MNISFFIAKRLIGKNEYRFSKPSIRIAITAVSLSLAIMLISLAIIRGFQNEISDKVIGFNSHIQVSNFLNGNSYESTILKQRDSLKILISEVKGIKHIQSYLPQDYLINNNYFNLFILIKQILIKIIYNAVYNFNQADFVHFLSR